MRIGSPVSRATLRIRFFLADVGLAALSPLLALSVSHALILTSNSLFLIISYWAVSLISSLIAFVVFRINEAIPRYLSVHDVMAVAKAVVLSELLASGIWFICTRLEDIPRSAQPLHALILGTGLLMVRALARIWDRRHAEQPRDLPCRNIILIGLNDLSFLYMEFLKACAATTHRVIAVLDDQQRWIGRSVGGVPVFGAPGQLEPLIEEFAVHGIHTHGVVIGGQPNILSEEALNEVRRICTQYNTDLVFVPHVFSPGFKDISTCASSPVFGICCDQVPDNFAMPRYFVHKRAIDFCMVLILFILVLPLLLVVMVLAFINVGSPIFFWQQRTGLHGRAFLLHKIRTLRPAFDRSGLPIPEHRHLSWIGSLLRKVRLDELPQLLNVLVGDMSLIGPRPLMPEDQPPNLAIRLMVRPGITGWAQVNGGNLLSPMEKGELDEWYIRNASLALDLRIVWLTVFGLLRGDLDAGGALAQAQASIAGLTDGNGFPSQQTAAACGAATATVLDPASNQGSQPPMIAPT